MGRFFAPPLALSLSLSLSLLAVAYAQERCDAPYPNVYCNTTEILQYQTQDCRPFHVFISRGSDEPYPGRLGNITHEICAAIGGEDCGFENVEYPAKSTAWGKDEWCKSAGKGAASGQAQMKAFSEKCPDSKLILLGFSQGAAVAQDILGGGGGHVFECDQAINPALDASTAPGKNVIAAVTFGAVVRSRDQNFTIGDTKNYDGKRARTPEQLKGLNQYADVLLDYCHYGDPMCAVGSTPEDVYVHLNYFEQHNDEVVRWVSGMAKASGDVSNDNRPSKPSSPQSSATSHVAKPAASPTAAPSSSTTDNSEAQASQTTNATGNGNTTGAASGLMASANVAALVVVLTAVVLQS
ncbi:alpha/beta-hydrolase [Pyrenochaeta sp. DS3sAY3a]|nr:alpha/beta-hydrolase [Pyrenochaeta sp. DS3sAY3a]